MSVKIDARGADLSAHERLSRVARQGVAARTPVHVRLLARLLGPVISYVLAGALRNLERDVIAAIEQDAARGGRFARLGR